MIKIHRLFVLFFVCNVSTAAVNPMNYPPPVRQKLIDLKNQCFDSADPTNKRPVYLKDSAVQKADLNGDGVQDFIVHESGYVYGGRYCGPVFGNSNGSTYIAVSGKNGLFKEAYYRHNGRAGDIYIDYRSKPNKITITLDNFYYPDSCGKDLYIKPNAFSTICNRTLLWNPITKRLDLGPITFTPQQRRKNASNDLDFQGQQRSHNSATVNKFKPQSDADYRNTGIPYQYRALSEPTDSLLQKVSDWLAQYDSVEKLSALGNISSQEVSKASDEFLYGQEGTIDFHSLKYDDGMIVECILGKPLGAEDFISILEMHITSNNLIQRLTGFKIGQEMVDIRNKLGSPHMITRGEKPNERIYFYFAELYGGVHSGSFSFNKEKDKRLELALRSQLSNFSAVYDENYIRPLNYNDQSVHNQSIWRVLFSFDENNLLKKVSFYFDPA